MQSRGILLRAEERRTRDETDSSVHSGHSFGILPCRLRHDGTAGGLAPPGKRYDGPYAENARVTLSTPPLLPAIDTGSEAAPQPGRGFASVRRKNGGKT